MTDTYVGRIFWKELRTQRAFWISVLGLAIGLQLLAVFALPKLNNWKMNDLSVLAGICRYWIALVLACSFAVGSVAIDFAGEIEGRTRGLLQRVPLRPRDLLAAKLLLSVLGAYLLFAALWFSGGLILTADALPTDPWSRSTAIGISVPNLEYALGPFLFVAVGSLISLVLGDVLITVIVAAITTAFLLAIPVIREHLALQGVMIAVAVVGDHFLARRWLRAGAAVHWTLPTPRIGWRARIVVERTVSGQRTVSEQGKRSAVAWRRAASSLLWKEWRQAFPICLTLSAIGLIAVGLTSLPHAPDWSWGMSLIRWFLLILVIPLVPGIAAVGADRKDNAFQSLANRGTTPDGYWILKHLVWLSLTLVFAAVLLAADTRFPSGPKELSGDSLWAMAAGAAHTVLHGDSPGIPAAEHGFVQPLLIAGFHVLLLYSLGYLLSLVLPGPLMVFFSGILIWLGIYLGWAFLAFLRVPFWWTIAPLPFLFLVVSWVRTSDWLIGRNTRWAWGKVAATFFVPLAAIFVATAAYRVLEIPAVHVPTEVLPAAAAVSGVSSKQSLFVDAIRAVSAQPHFPNEQERPVDALDRWKLVTPEQHKWLKANECARDLALEAVKQPPGTFAPLESFSPHGTGPVVMSALGWRLEQLLFYSARAYEDAGKFDDALACYMAVVRLGDDYSRSHANEITWAYRSRTARIATLQAMLHWAVSPKQTTERVQRTIQKFQTIAEQAPLQSTTLVQDWKIIRRQLLERLRNGSGVDETNRTLADLWWVRWFAPWELWRLERLVDLVFADRINDVQAIERALRDVGFVTMESATMQRWNSDQTTLRGYMQTTLNGADLDVVVNPIITIDQLAIERMSLIDLAVADFKRVHGKLPESLAVLVPTYFSRLPVDPWTGRDFLYEPKGVPMNVTFDNGALDKDTPFLASAGMFDSRFTVETTPGLAVVGTFIRRSRSTVVVSKRSYAAQAQDSFFGSRVRLP